MNSDQYKALKIAEVIHVSQGIIDGSIHPIDGVRRLNRLRMDVGDSPIFRPIVAIESESDSYVIGELRNNYSEDFLKTNDFEMSKYLDSTGKDLKKYCVQMIEHFKRISKEFSE